MLIKCSLDQSKEMFTIFSCPLFKLVTPNVKKVINMNLKINCVQHYGQSQPTPPPQVSIRTWQNSLAPRCEFFPSLPLVSITPTNQVILIPSAKFRNNSYFHGMHHLLQFDQRKFAPLYSYHKYGCLPPVQQV